jgi:hypothetical protein
MKLAIAKILDKRLADTGARLLGSSFCFSRHEGLTAFHCVGDRTAGTFRHSRVFLIFPGAKEIEATVEKGDAGSDVAILRLSEELPDNYQPIPLVVDIPPHTPFRCIGYPGGISGPDYLAISGMITDPDGSIFEGHPAMQLSCFEAAAGLLLPGYSGAPVLIGWPERAGGLIRWNPVENDDPRKPVGGIVFASPASLVLGSLPAIRPYVEAFSNVTDRMVSSGAVDRDLFPQSVKEDLKRLRSQQRFQKLEPKWMPIPSFSFGVPVETLKDRAGVRAFVTGMLEIFALGVSEVVPQDMQELQFVSLCDLRQVGSEYNLTLQTPFQELVGFMMDHVRPRMLPAQVKLQLEKFHIQFRLVNRCAAVEGSTVPFVTVYNPPLKKVLFTNENQIHSPKQFLNPMLCSSTSGFLNFVGTMMLLDTQEEPTAVFYEDLDKLVDRPETEQWFQWLLHFTDTRIAYQSSRLFVGSENPEEFRYYYPEGVRIPDNKIA